MLLSGVSVESYFMKVSGNDLLGQYISDFYRRSEKLSINQRSKNYQQMAPEASRVS